jgi:hypothetical protein
MHASVAGVRFATHVDALTHAATPQVGWHVTAITGASSGASLGFVLVVLITGVVVVPAVWSRQPARRKAATDVLERLTRFVTDVLDRLIRLRSK